MKRYLLLAVLAIPASAQITFNGTRYDNCTVSISCGATPAPTPAPSPTPSPPIQPPAGARQMLTEGSNHWDAIAMPGTTISYVLPANSGTANFATYPFRTAGGMELEVSISATPGDFSTYKNNVVWGQTPCGFRTQQVDASIRWGTALDFLTCGVPVGAQWYLNIRYHGSTCPTNMSPPGCAVTFGWHRG